MNQTYDQKAEQALDAINYLREALKREGNLEFATYIDAAFDQCLSSYIEQQQSVLMQNLVPSAQNHRLN